MKCFLTRVIRGEEIYCLYRSQLVTRRIVPKIVRFYFCVTRFFAREGSACSAKRLRYFSPSGPSLVTVIASSAVGITCITVTPCLSCAQCHVIQFKPIVRLSPLQKERETNLLNSILWLYFFHQFHTLYSELYSCVRVFLSFYTWMMSKRAKSYNSDITEMMFPCDFCNSKAAVLYCRADSAKLCLFCDQQVHSTNALSLKHVRFPICDSCRIKPISVWCSMDNLMLCQHCDLDSHNNCSVSSLHNRVPVEGYSGYHTAIELASMFGIDLKANNLVNTNSGSCLHEQKLVNSHEFMVPSDDSSVWKGQGLRCGKCRDEVYEQLVEMGNKDRMRVDKDGEDLCPKTPPSEFAQS